MNATPRAETNAIADGRATSDIIDPDAKARLAHELRTPLAAIHSLADVIAEERFGPVENERYRSYATSMRDAARHLISVIETMLADVSGDMRKRDVSSDVSVDLGDVARTVSLLLVEFATRRASVLQLDLATDLPPILADRTAVAEMVINLASNALRHSGLGADITFRTGRDSLGNAWIEIEDNGPGLPAKIATGFSAQSFDHVSQVPEAAFPATGRLGLPLTDALARANGARLSFLGANPTGTRARITFPPGSQI